MKIKHFLLSAVALVCAAAFTSCSDDDNNKKFLNLSGQQANFGGTTGIVWMDATVYQGKFYSLVVSVEPNGEKMTEKYELYTSTDGANWTKVNYTVDGAAGIMGGEGARLVVHNGKLVVFGGLRTKGYDIYNDSIEVSDGWFGPAPDSYFRVWESSNGTAFTTVNDITVMNGDRDMTPYADMYGNPYTTIVSYNGKLVLYGGYSVSYGMYQGSRSLLISENGKDWTVQTTTDAEGNNIYLNHIGCSLYEMNGKLYVASGFNNFIGATNCVQATVWSSTDLATWTNETAADETAAAPAVYQAKVVSNGKTAIMLGGETYDAETGVRALNTKVYTTTDGLHWAEAEMPELADFTGYRYPVAAVNNGHAYVLGGYTTPSSGNYAAPADADLYETKAWTVTVK